MSHVALSMLLVTAGARIDIRGNEVLPAKLYLDLLARDGGASHADKESAKRLARTAQSYLRSIGYEIARVRGRVRDGRILLRVDEGHLSRVVFIGQGDVNTAQLKLALEIPYMIFNRPLIARHLRRLRKELGFTEIDLEVVHTEAVEHSGPQLDELDALPGSEMLETTGDHELHVILGRREWETGLGVLVDVKPPDGFKLGASYAGRSLLFTDDRWRASAAAAVNEYRALYVAPAASAPSALPPPAGTFAELSRATADLTWATPAWVGLRPALSAFADLMTRNRPEVGLEISVYRLLELGALLGIDWDVSEGLILGVAGGISSRWLFDIRQPTVAAGVGDPATTRVQPWNIVAALARAKAHLVFDPETLRIDKHHELFVDLHAYFGSEPRPRVQLRLQYQKYFTVGWHDALVRARGFWAWGKVRFTDEESLGFFTRSVFGWRHWIRFGGSLNPELRFSIVRDLFKIGVFVDAAVFESRARAGGTARVMVAVGAGPSAHLLLFDAFQADFAYAFGMDSDGAFEHGFSGALRKAF